MNEFLLKQIVATLTSLLVILQGLVSSPGLLKLQSKPTLSNSGLLGAATVTSGFNFPTTTQSFQDGDIINSGDFNLILDYIGPKDSTSTVSLTYKLTSSSSLDPGHKHSTSAVSGTIAVAQGGTATTTFAKGLVMASGTDALSVLQTNGNGSIPIASGTSWVANTLTAGANISITTGAGSTTIASDQGLFGDGSDGNVTISATTTLSRDMYYNNLTINSGITLFSGGYRIFGKGTLTHSGIVANNGGNGSNASAGTGGAGGTAASSTNIDGGGSSSNGANGTASNGSTPTTSGVGGSKNPGFGVAGVKGGSGGSSANTSAGAAGNNGSSTQSRPLSFVPSFAFATGTTSTLALTPNTTTTASRVGAFWDYTSSSAFLGGSGGSSGGGGGGGDTGSQGGGGGGAGAPGGIVELVFKTIVNNGDIQAKGGNGGNGANGSGGSAGGGGGGGGGSGGVVLLAYSEYSGTGTITISGGSAGTKGTGAGTGNDGVDGTAGSTGNVYRLIVN